METASRQKSTPRWLLVVFAALPLPIYLGVLVATLAYFIDYVMDDEVPALLFVIAIPFVFPVLYVLTLQLSVVRSALRQPPPLVKLGRRIALLHVRIFFCLTFAAWLPAVEVLVLIGKTVISAQIDVFYPLVLFHVALIGITIAASGILLRGSWKVVRAFAPPRGPNSGRQPDADTRVAPVSDHPIQRHKLHKVGP